MMRSLLGTILAVTLASCAASGSYVGPTPAWVADTSSFTPGGPPRVRSVADAYQGVADKIIAAARADRGAYDKLAHLTDKIGHRLAGSAALDKAIAWAAQAMTDDGLTVRTEKVMVPHWQRGREEAVMIGPTSRALRVLGLGGTVSTPEGGLAAPVIVVHDWKELDVRRNELLGRIVLFNVPMPAWSAEHGSGYGAVVDYRWDAASRAARYGAAAVLVRSLTARSLDTPHTGSMGYDKDAPRIPAASITIEDAELIDRLASKGAVQIRLRLESQMHPDAPSANVIGELRGHELPDEIVLIGAHLDSWDVGQGAHDDGAGVVAMMQALATLKRLGLTPRRTIRVVLFTNEENGLRGGKAYAKDHEAELANHVAALEADMGGFAPTGFGISHKDPEAATRGRDRLADIAMLLRTLGATTVDLGGGGADISPMKSAGVPQISLDVDNRTYFDYHHTTADTLDKVKPQDLADMAAATAVFAYVVADMPGRLDAPLSSAAPALSSPSQPAAASLPLVPAPQKPPLPF